MHVLQSLLYSLIQVLDFLILVRCLLSFLFMGTSNKLTEFVYSVTEPVLAPIRALLDRTPLGGMMLDFSPVVAMVLLNFLGGLVMAF